MSKASKWIRNFLMGKREDRGKKTGPSLTAELGIVAVTNNAPKVRRRWSFKRSTSTKPTTHKKTPSFDSVFLPTKQCNASLEYRTYQYNAMSLLLNPHAAATKIQAVYRSYLARRALRALRGLVKLQALARGHLVRKQTNNVVRSMHALMAIQVRARIHRIQTAEEQPPVMVASRKSSASDRQLRKDFSDGNNFPTSGGLRSKSVHIYQTRAEREYQLKMCPSPSTTSFTDSSSATYEGRMDELLSKMASLREDTDFPENKHPFYTLPPSQCQEQILPHSHFKPNYMTNTTSSKAKARSHSEPRQRPKLGTKQKSRRTSSMDGKNQYPWLTKLYRSDKSTNQGDCDYNISHMDNISKSLIPFEAPWPRSDLYKTR